MAAGSTVASWLRLSPQPSAGRYVLGVGLLTVFVLLAVLVWTRFGQRGPLPNAWFCRCWLICCCSSTPTARTFLYGPPGKWTVKSLPCVCAMRPIRRNRAGEIAVAQAVAAGRRLDAPLAAVAGRGCRRPAAAAGDDCRANRRRIGLAAHRATAAAADYDIATCHAKSPADRATDSSADLPDLPPSQKPPADFRAANSARCSPLSPAANGIAAERRQRSARRNGNRPIRRRDKESRCSPLGDGQQVPEPLQARVAADRLQAAQPFGATPRTEAAVAAALDWLANAQSNDGRWDADAHGAGRGNKNAGASIAAAAGDPGRHRHHAAWPCWPFLVRARRIGRASIA